MEAGKIKWIAWAAAICLGVAGCRGIDAAIPDVVIDASGPGTMAAADAADAAESPGMLHKAQLLQGPVKKLGDWCKKCKVKKKLKPGKKSPYKAVMILTDKWGSPAPGPQMNTGYHLAIQTGQGWFYKLHLGTDGILCGGDSLFSVGFNLLHFELKDVVPGKPGEVVITFEEWSDSMTNKEIMVCSIGASGKPGCVGPLIVDSSKSCCGKWKPVFLPDGRLEFRAGKEVTGPFTLVFP